LECFISDAKCQRCQFSCVCVVPAATTHERRCSAGALRLSGQGGAVDGATGALPSLWDTVVVAAYVPALVLFGAWVSRRQLHPEDYFLASRGSRCRSGAARLEHLLERPRRTCRRRLRDRDLGIRLRVVGGGHPGVLLRVSAAVRAEQPR